MFQSMFNNANFKFEQFSLSGQDKTKDWGFPEHFLNQLPSETYLTVLQLKLGLFSGSHPEWLDRTMMDEVDFNVATFNFQSQFRKFFQSKTAVSTLSFLAR